MAVSGTATKVKTNYQTTNVTVTGLTGSGNVTPLILGEGLPYSTAQITYTGTVPTSIQLRAGNDGVQANMVALGAAVTSFPALAVISPGDLPYLYHDWVLTGGASDTLVTITEVMMGTIG